MLKGINKNVIVVKGDKNSRFEAVYMVMKKDAARGDDILKEADRIISQSNVAEKTSKKLPRWFVFLLGILGGGGAVGVVSIILALSG